MQSQKQKLRLTQFEKTYKKHPNLTCALLFRLRIELEKFWPLRLRFGRAKGLKSNF